MTPITVDTILWTTPDQRKPITNLILKHSLKMWDLLNIWVDCSLYSLFNLCLVGMPENKMILSLLIDTSLGRSLPKNHHEALFKSSACSNRQLVIFICTVAEPTLAGVWATSVPSFVQVEQKMCCTSQLSKLYKMWNP